MLQKLNTPFRGATETNSRHSSPYFVTHHYNESKDYDEYIEHNSNQSLNPVRNTTHSPSQERSKAVPFYQSKTSLVKDKHSWTHWAHNKAGFQSPAKFSCNFIQSLPHLRTPVLASNTSTASGLASLNKQQWLLQTMPTL